MQRLTPAILNIIIINVLVYMAQTLLPQFNVTEWGALHFFRSPLFKPHQLITHMFMHDTTDIGHLLFNMLGLWIFGSMVEETLGSKRFLVFYFICGLGAGILTEFTIPFSADLFAKSADGIKIAMENNATSRQIADAVAAQYTMVGASGAVMGVSAAFAYLFPNMPLYLFLIPFPIKAKYLVSFYILMDVLGGFQRVPGDNVSHFTHLGGALVGFLFVYYWKKSNHKTFY